MVAAARQRPRPPLLRVGWQIAEASAICQPTLKSGGRGRCRAAATIQQLRKSANCHHRSIPYYNSHSLQFLPPGQKTLCLDFSLVSGRKREYNKQNTQFRRKNNVTWHSCCDLGAFCRWHLLRGGRVFVTLVAALAAGERSGRIPGAGISLEKSMSGYFLYKLSISLSIFAQNLR